VRIAFIAVSYRTLPDAVRFASLFKSGNGNVRVALVDNSDGDQLGLLCKQIQTLNTPVACLTSPGNLGYFGGARYGLEHPYIRDFNPDWLIVCNVDLVFEPNDLINGLAHHEAETTGVVAPYITSMQTGRPLNPFMSVRPMRVRMLAYKLIFHWYWGLAIYTKMSTLYGRVRRMLFPPPSRGLTRGIYAAHGSMFILSREFFKRGGTLDYEPLIFGEEICIAEQARKMGLPVRFDVDIPVSHEEHSSTNRLASRTHHKFVSSAASYVVDKYFSGPANSGS
jgi:GT2 family glycosyltransferase